MSNTVQRILEIAFSLSREDQILVATKILNGVVSQTEVSPEPDLEKRIGNTKKVVDVTTESLFGENVSADSFSPAQLSQVFEIDTDSKSLVNLVRSGKVTIETIILDRRSDKVPPYSVPSSYQKIGFKTPSF